MSAAARTAVAVVRETAPELAAFPELLPFATQPIVVTCRHGCHEYAARQVAMRQGRILFIDPRTAQFGIAVCRDGEGVEARQYPSSRTAVIMFLGAWDAIDAD
jgi:hypothetical protein